VGTTLVVGVLPKAEFDKIVALAIRPHKELGIKDDRADR
jgi:hypothetical protein